IKFKAVIGTSISHIKNVHGFSTMGTGMAQPKFSHGDFFTIRPSKFYRQARVVATPEYRHNFYLLVQKEFVIHTKNPLKVYRETFLVGRPCNCPFLTMPEGENDRAQGTLCCKRLVCIAW